MSMPVDSEAQTIPPLESTQHDPSTRITQLADNTLSPHEEEAELLRQNTRSPHPYLRHGHAVHQDGRHAHHVRALGRGARGSQQGRSDDSSPSLSSEHEGDGRNRQDSDTRNGLERRSSGQDNDVTGSESGTEADDERPEFVKALPAPEQRPRKGLIVGERSEEALLTPSQLDEGEGYAGGYFRGKHGSRGEDRGEGDGEEAGKKRSEEEERLFRRRVHEFARRASEVVLVGLLALCVLCGRGVADVAWRWRWELGCHIGVAAALVAIYPVKLSVVDTRAIYARPWQRFRVPASFDPATVLYPPLLPLLVALTLAPLDERIVLPNLILGLAALPQRLFPRSSRLAGVNAVHWFIALLPLILCENGFYLPEPFRNGFYPHDVRGGLPREILATLYPLHHALLQPLHHLTTTSLLITELHLLSTALINLLLFASTPQTHILKACLLVGGIAVFVATERVLHWNVTLARVPRWKFRRTDQLDRERKSLADAVGSLISVQRATSAFGRSTQGPTSDADEDAPGAATLKQPPNGRLKLATKGLFAPALESRVKPEPLSATEPRSHTPYGSLRGGVKTRSRRNTLPVNLASTPPRPLSTRRRTRPGGLLWCLRLTPSQAARRKVLYAVYVYTAVVAIVLGPVRWYVGKHALDGAEPVAWALSYLFADLHFFRTLTTSLGLAGSWIPLLPLSPPNPSDADLSAPLDLRASLGPANTRLLLAAYWLLTLGLGLATVVTLTPYAAVDSRRKVFHALMVLLLLPTTFIDPCAVALALALILAVFLLLEVIRAGQVGVLGEGVGRFVAPYVDGRDLRGPVVVSHVFLLVGCAVPLWFSLASTLRAGDIISPLPVTSNPSSLEGRSSTAPGLPSGSGWELAGKQRDVGMLAGVVCVGLGDAAASLIGRRFGRRKWVWVGGKSLEGSAAFALAVTFGLTVTKIWLVGGGWEDGGGEEWGRGVMEWAGWLTRALLCACGASFLEAVLTGANDNVVVPVALWLFVKGVRL